MRRSARHVAVLAVAAVLAVLAACGGSNGDDTATPGYDGRNKPVDTSPFQMANPSTTDGPTTIPGPGPTLPLPAMFQTTTTDAPRVVADGSGGVIDSQTTTSLEPISDPGTSTAPCEAFFVIAQAGRDVQLRFADNPNSDFQSAKDRLVAAFNQAINILTPRLAEGPDPAVSATLRSRILAMRDLASQARTIADGGKVYYPLQSAQGPGEQVGWGEILTHLTRYCAAVPRSFGLVV